MNEQRTDDRIYDTSPTVPQPPSRLPNEPYYQQPAYPQPNAGNRNGRRALGVALVVIGLLWFAFGGLRFGPFGGGSDTLYDNTVAGNRLEMNVGSGDVQIRAWNQEGIHITAIQQGGGRDTYAVDVSQSGDTVRVSQREKEFFSFFDDANVRYEVQIPADLQAEIQTSSGEISIDGSSGGVTLTTASGDVEARNTSNGITIDTASGEVKLRDAAGKIDVKSVSGDIELNDVADTLNLQSVSGEIAVRDARNVRLAASTTSGDIQYNGELAAGGKNKISSISGEVDVRLPDDSGLRVDAHTTSGEVNSDFPLNGDRGTTILSVETTSGDIRVK